MKIIKVDHVIMASLLELMKQAIKSQDWNVDGACDPTRTIDLADSFLSRRGWTYDAKKNEYIHETEIQKV